MNIRSRILKIAKKILSDLEFTSHEQLREYAENHEIRPDTVIKVDGIVVPNPNQGKNQGGNDEKIQMTDEQKKLHEMAMNGSYKDKDYVSTQYNTHPYTLYLLSHEGDKEIPQNVSSNPNMSIKKLCNFINDMDECDKCEFIKNPSTPSEALEILSYDDYYMEDIIKHPNVTAKILEKFLKDKTYRKDVIYKMLEFPNLSEDSLDELHSYVVNEDDDEIAGMFVDYCYDNGYDNCFSDYYLNGKLDRYDSYGDGDYTYYEDNSSNPIWRELAKRDGFEYDKNSGGSHGAYSSEYIKYMNKFR